MSSGNDYCSRASSPCHPKAFSCQPNDVRVSSSGGSHRGSLRHSAKQHEVSKESVRQGNSAQHYGEHGDGEEPLLAGWHGMCSKTSLIVVHDGPNWCRAVRTSRRKMPVPAAQYEDRMYVTGSNEVFQVQGKVTTPGTALGFNPLAYRNSRRVWGESATRRICPIT
jgi:hypothetical protein